MRTARSKRERVEIGRYRPRRWTPPPAHRPSWRDDSELVLWLRAWRAERDARRALQSIRHQQPGRSGDLPPPDAAPPNHDR